MAAARGLVTANLRLVVKIAHEYRKAHQNLLDLIQEGNVGLVQAVLKYDPYRGVKLSTYAAWWIRAYILKSILNNWRMVKIGTTQAQRKLFFNLRKQKDDLERMGITPTSAEVAKALDVTETEVIEMERRLAAPDLSLSAPLGRDDGSSRTFYDVIPEDKSPPDEQVESAQFRALLRDKLEKFAERLTGRDKVIYDKRLMADPPLTLKEIGDSYGVSRERARQLEKRLLGKLREYLKEEMGDAVEIAMGWES
jgi:RNA polymerase sigma-32 factor